MPESEIVRLAKSQKRKILERDAEVMRELTRRWLDVEKALEAEMLNTALQLSSEQMVTDAMVLKNKRFQNLMYQARAEYSKYAEQFEKRAVYLQEVNAGLGLKDAAAMLDTSLKMAGVQTTFDKLNVEALNMVFGFTADGTPLKTLLDKSYGEAATSMVDKLVGGLAKGLNPTKVARNMADGFGEKVLQRALTIARTEQLRAYRMGTLEQYRDSGMVVQYKRMATHDDLTCVGCLFADGETFDSVDEFSEHPNGRCTLVPIVVGLEAPTWESGQQWFENLPADRQMSILGQSRYDAWQNGTPLSEMSKHLENSTWGGSFVPTPLSELSE